MMNNEVRRFLIELARNRINQTITYQKLSDACNLGLNMQEGAHIRKKMGDILGEISRFEHENQRPLLSALVLRLDDQTEGDGFYKLAEALGFGDWRKLKREGTFEVLQIRECIDFWTNNQNYNNLK